MRGGAAFGTGDKARCRAASPAACRAPIDGGKYPEFDRRRRSSQLRPAASAGGAWQFARRRPLYAAASLAAAALIVLFLLPKTDREKRFNESQAAFVQQALVSYDALVKDVQQIQIRSSDPQALREFFKSNGVSYDVHVPQLQHASLVGGWVSSQNAARVAHVIYQCGTRYVSLCQIKMTDACPTNSTAVSDSARSCICAGKWYWYRDAANRSVGLWKIDDTLCAATSDCDPGEIAALFTESH